MTARWDTAPLHPFTTPRSLSNARRLIRVLLGPGAGKRKP